MNNILSLDDIRIKAPSVFAETPYHMMSPKYRFFPTSEVVAGLIAQGFQPMMAGQSRSRTAGKADFTKHLLRFRHDDLGALSKVGDEIPEIVLVNSHDGTSSYQIMLGFFRLVCSNGMVVKSSTVDEIRVRHSGRETLIDDVIEGTFQIISEAPRVLEQVAEWKGTDLSLNEQRALAEAAVAVRETSLEITADDLLRPRRIADAGAGRARSAISGKRRTSFRSASFAGRSTAPRRKANARSFGRSNRWTATPASTARYGRSPSGCRN